MYWSEHTRTATSSPELARVAYVDAGPFSNVIQRLAFEADFAALPEVQRLHVHESAPGHVEATLEAAVPVAELLDAIRDLKGVADVALVNGWIQVTARG
jgi:hypothetical protein